MTLMWVPSGTSESRTGGMLRSISEAKGKAWLDTGRGTIGKMKVVCVKDSSTDRVIAHLSDPVNHEFVNAMLGRMLDFSAEEHVAFGAVNGSLSLPLEANLLRSEFTLGVGRKHCIEATVPMLAWAHQDTQPQASSKGPVHSAFAVSGRDDGRLAETLARTGPATRSKSGLQYQEPVRSNGLQQSVEAVQR